MNKGFTMVIVICLGLLLSLFAIGYFKDTQNKDDKSIPLPRYQNNINVVCGLTIYNPRSLSVNKNPINISGFANGCGWGDEGNNIVGTVKIVNDRSIIIYQNKIISNTQNPSFPINFDFDIQIDEVDLTRKGNIIFSNDKTGFEERIVKVPVYFW